VLENEITVLRFSEVGGGRLLGTDPYARFLGQKWGVGVYSVLGGY